MTKALLKLSLVIITILSAASCSRSSREVIEDSKTAGNYFGKGFRSIGGKQVESRAIKDPSEFAKQGPSDFVPLAEAQNIPGSFGLSDNPIPQSEFSPGDPGSEIPGIEAFHSPSTVEQQQIFRNIHFDTNKHEVVFQEDSQTIKKIASYMKQNPKLFLFTEGHCDERGAANYNMALGTRRSNSVRKALVQEGIDPNRIFTISYGLERPISTGHGPESWKENRRAQFKLYWR